MSATQRLATIFESVLDHFHTRLDVVVASDNVSDTGNPDDKVSGVRAVAVALASDVSHAL